MLFSRWFQSRRQPRQSFRPAIHYLEDRTVPSGLHMSAPMPGPATSLEVVVPEHVTSGQSFKVLVEVEDASNHLATGYTGSVSLTSPTDTSATLPTAYTFGPSDHGEHWFQVTLVATGSETIDATGTLPASTSTIVGHATTEVYPAPVATTVVVTTPETAAVGVPTRVTVEIEDQSGHLLRNYTGAVTLSSNPTGTGTAQRHTTAAPLPITYTFTAEDHGQHTFEVTFATGVATGTATTVTASAATGATTSIIGTASLNVYPATTVTHFGIWTSPLAVVGSPTPVFVEALNASNQVVTGYTGTVSFSSSDTGATISATSGGTAAALTGFTYGPFTAGKHEFWVTFSAAGQPTLTVADTTSTSVTGSTQVNVVANLRWHLFRP